MNAAYLVKVIQRGRWTTVGRHATREEAEREARSLPVPIIVTHGGVAVTSIGGSQWDADPEESGR